MALTNDPSAPLKVFPPSPPMTQIFDDMFALLFDEDGAHQFVLDQAMGAFLKLDRDDALARLDQARTLLATARMVKPDEHTEKLAGELQSRVDVLSLGLAGRVLLGSSSAVHRRLLLP